MQMPLNVVVFFLLRKTFKIIATIKNKIYTFVA